MADTLFNASNTQGRSAGRMLGTLAFILDIISLGGTTLA